MLTVADAGTSSITIKLCSFKGSATLVVAEPESEKLADSTFVVDMFDVVPEGGSIQARGMLTLYVAVDPLLVTTRLKPLSKPMWQMYLYFILGGRIHIQTIVEQSCGLLGVSG